jgi:hypothetical protein
MAPLARGSPAELLVFEARHERPELDVLGPGARLRHREHAQAGDVVPTD